MANLDTNQNEDLFSLAPDIPQKPQKAVVVNPIPVEQPHTPVYPDKESISSLGTNYKVNNFTVTKQSSQKEVKGFPYYLLATLILVPLMFIFVIGAISKKNENTQSDSFIFKTLESKYFTLTYSPDYSLQSVVDKKIPFIEKHNLDSTVSGEKHISILIKDVKFDYKLDDNSVVKARRGSDKFQEKPYDIRTKQGLMFKKVDENFEQVIVVLDRNKSLLYEIVFTSPTNLANNEDLEREFKAIVDSITFL